MKEEKIQAMSVKVRRGGKRQARDRKEHLVFLKGDIMQSELHCYTYRTFIGVILARLLLPFLLLKYKDFWGLHKAALHSK